MPRTVSQFETWSTSFTDAASSLSDLRRIGSKYFSAKMFLCSYTSLSTSPTSREGVAQLLRAFELHVSAKPVQSQCFKFYSLGEDVFVPVFEIA